MTGDPSPFDFDEVVTIFPSDMESDPETATLYGKRGVITGMILAEEAGEWYYTLAIQSGENWCFFESELKSTGITVTAEMLYAPRDEAVLRVRVNPETGEGTVVSGDPSLFRGPMPLQIDLEALS